MISSIAQRSSQVLLDNYGRLPLAMVRGKGAELFDEQGKRYIDLFAGFGAGGLLGHCHPAVVAAIQRQSEQLLSHGNLFTSEPQVALAERLQRELPGARVFFCHSGAEAAEAALKLVRKAHQDRYKIVCFENCFHGRTMGALSLCPESFQQGFEPMLEGALRIPFNDIEALERTLNHEIAAVFIEPIQGEGGMNIPSLEFMKRLRSLCDEYEILLVCDEVWTAPGRTGAFFAWQHFDILPDAVTMAKALGGGVPLAALLVARPWTEVLGPGSHGCTMGGNPLCAAAGLAAITEMDERELIARATTLGEECIAELSAADIPTIRSLRGKGMMWGAVLVEASNAKEVMLRCLEKGVCIGSAKQNVIRFAPPLSIDRDLLSEGLEIVKEVLTSDA